MNDAHERALNRRAVEQFASDWIQRLVALQNDASDRALLCRLTTGVAVIRTVWHLPPGTLFTDYSDLLDDAEGAGKQRFVLPPAAYESMRVAAILSVGAWALGVDNPAVKIAANTSFGALQWYVVQFHPELWSYNRHLNLFLGALSLIDGRDEAEPSHAVPAAVISVLQATYACVYLQSGISKLVGTGWGWMRGDTLRAAWGELGTPTGKALARQDPRVAAAASATALVFELAFAPLLLLFWRRRAMVGLSSAAFHAAVKATMNISFWHLSWFSVPLFSLGSGMAARLCSGLTGRRARILGATLVMGAATRPLLHARHEMSMHRRVSAAARRNMGVAAA